MEGDLDVVYCGGNILLIAILGSNHCMSHSMVEQIANFLKLCKLRRLSINDQLLYMYFMSKNVHIAH